MMKSKYSFSRKVFLVANYIFISLVAVICIAPILNLLAISFSSSTAVNANKVSFWPVDFSINSYKFVINNPRFITAFWISVKRVLLGVGINMLLTVLAAYPLSKGYEKFRFRKVYMWFFIIPMVFSSGLIPLYMVINKVGLINSIWALVLPGAVPIFNVILMLNFFKGVPNEIEESAFMDGASYIKSLVFIYLPLSLPSLATVTLFCLVRHWNSWFDGIILMNSPEKYPLQSYLRTVLVSVDPTYINLELIGKVDERTNNAAQVFIAMIPVMVVYPYLQKYFTKGIVLGSIKG